MTRLSEDRIGRATRAVRDRIDPQQLTTDFLIDVARGEVPGMSLVHKFGSNTDIDTTSTPEDVWETGGQMAWPKLADVVTVVSSDATDDGNPTTNTGAHTLSIEGLDVNFEELNESVTLNGTTNVNTVGEFIRVNRAYVTSCGTYHGTNVGNITGLIGVDNLFTIGAGIGQTKLARYTVPANKTAILLQTEVWCSSTKTATVHFNLYENADDLTQPFSGAVRQIIDHQQFTGEAALQSQYVVIPEKSDLWVEVTFVGSNNTTIDADFQLLLIETG